MREPLMNLYTRVEPKLFKDLATAATKNQTTIQAIVGEAIKLWLSQRNGKKK